MLVAPSILSADFGILTQEVKSVCEAQCDLIHIDVMDGHFVPNLTMGPMIVNAVAKSSTKPLDIHLMVEDNNFFIDLFAPLKPKYISFHLESEKHPHRVIQKIRNLNIKPAIVLNPHTNPNDIKYLIKDLDMVLLMSVNPGFGGQSFISSTLDKAVELKELINMYNPKCLIEIDGGVNDKNIYDIKNANIDIVVAGNYIYKSSDYKKAILSLKI